MPLPDPTTAPPFFSLLPNTIGVPTKWERDKEGMGAVDIAYAAGRFVLGPDEALLVVGKMPRCRFANVVLWNRYLQTFEYESFYKSTPGGITPGPVTLSSRQLRTNADGSFVVVLAGANPFQLGTDMNSTAATFLWTDGRSTGA
jgi:hypothetical protein